MLKNMLSSRNLHISSEKRELATKTYQEKIRRGAMNVLQPKCANCSSKNVFQHVLYIVATPIGNLEDITLRAIRTLKEVDYIAAEDTRHSAILLKKYEIKTPTVSFHAHSGEQKLQKILDLLKEGKKIALIADAGTPGISDPGYVLIHKAIEAGIKIVPIPGPSAFLTALSVSGLPTNTFLYLGFLPLKKGRKTLIQSFKEEKRTIVFYESPHRIIRTLKELSETLGNRPVVLARELTKVYEEIWRGNLLEATKYYEGRSPKGEFVIVLGQPVDE